MKLGGWCADGRDAGYSGYLTERQNRLEFFISYRISESLAPVWDDQIERGFIPPHRLD